MGVCSEISCEIRVKPPLTDLFLSLSYINSSELHTRHSVPSFLTSYILAMMSYRYRKSFFKSRSCCLEFHSLEVSGIGSVNTETVPDRVPWLQTMLCSVTWSMGPFQHVRRFKIGDGSLQQSGGFSEVSCCPCPARQCSVDGNKAGRGRRDRREGSLPWPGMRAMS